MYEMSREEWWGFASAGTRTGKLAVVRADGSPHVTPVWFLLHETPDGDELIFTTVKESLKGKAFRRNARFSLCVDDQAPPYAYVQFTADAVLHDDLDEMLEWATAIGGRYMGPERGAEYGKRNADPGECLVRAKIVKVLAFGGVSD